MNLIKILIFC